MNKTLHESIRAIFIAVPLASMVIGIVFGLALAIQEGSIKAMTDTLFVGAMITIAGSLLAVIPSLLYGAPLYALLCQRGLANYVSSITIGVAPALVIVPFDGKTAIWVCLFGALIAALTHRFYKGTGRTPENTE